MFQGGKLILVGNIERSKTAGFVGMIIIIISNNKMKEVFGFPCVCDFFFTVNIFLFTLFKAKIALGHHRLKKQKEKNTTK